MRQTRRFSSAKALEPAVRTNKTANAAIFAMTPPCIDRLAYEAAPSRHDAKPAPTSVCGLGK
jgi:hypothetical protein